MVKAALAGVAVLVAIAAAPRGVSSRAVPPRVPWLAGRGTRRT